MRFDVSELKSLQTCERQWKLTSRNAYHLRPASHAANPNLVFGALFHEALHAMYLGGNIDTIIEQTLRELGNDEPARRTMSNMLSGYYEEVLPGDLEKYQVLDIEHSVHIRLPELSVYDILPSGERVLNEEDSVEICGSIDMLLLEKETGAIHGFEHKTTKTFRDDIQIIMDEQPRVYFLELQRYVEKLNVDWAFKTSNTHKITLAQALREVPYKVGSIHINEVKKVQRKFEYKRRACRYSPEQIDKFAQKLSRVGRRIQDLSMNPDVCTAQPGYMTCKMCDYATICETYGYEEPELEELLDEFAEEYQIRDVDHLDEKMERTITGEADNA